MRVPFKAHVLRWALRSLLLSALIATAGCAAPGSDLRVRLPDGRRMLFHCEGKGGPVVVLEAAYASPWQSWGVVQPALARRTRVCSYNRAGILGSDPGPLPRDGNAIAADLAAGLHAARIAPPYVLVGHSIGGLYVRAFYAQHPKQVAGMVLVDPSAEDQEQRFAWAFPGSGGDGLEPLKHPARECVQTARAVLAGKTATIPVHCGSDPKVVVGIWSNELSELESLGGSTSSEIDNGPQSYGTLPLIVLTAASTYRGPPQQVWMEMHRKIAAKSTRGETRLVANSGHNIPHDRSNEVVAAVNDVLRRAETRSRD